MAFNVTDLAGGDYFSIEAKVLGSAVTSVGTLISLPEVEGKLYRIEGLYNNGNASQTTSNITFIVDGVTLLDNETIRGPGGANTLRKNDLGGNIFDTITCKSFSIIGNAGIVGRPSIICSYLVGSFES